jgi:pimeloyl-ACP methyl ester carboxylesterase
MRVTMLDGAGHMPHFEQAVNVAKLVEEFLGA